MRLVLGNITDFGITPGVQPYYNTAQRARVTDAIMQANAKIQAIADQRVIPVIDTFSAGNLSMGDSFTIAGVPINPRGASDDPHDFFLSDDVHPGTVVQGLFANMFIEAINRAYRAAIEPLSDQEILANAGIPDPNTGADPIYFDVSGFVHDPTGSPMPDFNGDGIVDGADMCIMVDHWHTDEPAYDIAPPPYGDGIVDVQDLIVLAEHLFEQFPPVEPVEVNVNEDDDGGQVELELGQILVVTLESNPTAGYWWEWEQAENPESILEQIGEAEFKPSETGEPPLVGAGGWEIFRFKAVSVGQMTLELVYHRSWEDVEPLKTFSIQVVVR